MKDLRPPAIVWAYWKEIMVIEEDAVLLEPAYLEAA